MKKLLLLLCLAPWVGRAQLTTGNGPYFLGASATSNTVFALQLWTNQASPPAPAAGLIPVTGSLIYVDNILTTVAPYNTTVSLSGLQLFDAVNGNTALNWGNRTLNDSNANVAASWPTGAFVAFRAVSQTAYLVNSNTLTILPTLSKGDNLYWSSNGVPFVTASGPTGILTTNVVGIKGIYGGSSGPITLPISGTYFMAPNNDFTNAAADTSGATRSTIPCDGTLTSLFVTTSASPGAVANTVTIMTNGVSTGIVATLNAVTSANDTTHQVAVLAGTEVGVKVVTGAGTAVRWGWGFQLR